MFNFLKNIFKKKVSEELVKEKYLEPTDENFKNPNVQMFEIKADGSMSYFIGLDSRPERQKQIYFESVKKGKKVILKYK